VEEKTQLMRRIYESAFGTAIWLGKSWDKLTLALTAIKKLAAASAGRKAALAKDFGPYTRFLKNLPKHKISPGNDWSEFRDFSNLLQNPWFTRAWVFSRSCGI
jgi:hypothetical protein